VCACPLFQPLPNGGAANAAACSKLTSPSTATQLRIPSTLVLDTIPSSLSDIVPQAWRRSTYRLPVGDANAMKTENATVLTALDFAGAPRGCGSHLEYHSPPRIDIKPLS
jgi:hypothetical protein